MPWSSKVAGRTAQLRTAQAALSRFQNRAWARKSDGVPDFDRQQQRRQDRADLKVAVEILEPIIGEHLKACVQADREAEEAKSEIAKTAARPAYSNAPGARIGESPQAHNEAASLESFKAAVGDVLATSPDTETARRRVQALLATEATRLSIFRK